MNLAGSKRRRQLALFFHQGYELWGFTTDRISRFVNSLDSLASEMQGPGGWLVITGQGRNIEMTPQWCDASEDVDGW